MKWLSISLNLYHQLLIDTLLGFVRWSQTGDCTLTPNSILQSLAQYTVTLTKDLFKSLSGQDYTGDKLGPALHNLSPGL